MEPFDAKEFARITYSMLELEYYRVMHDRTELYIRAVQPALWLVLFGYIMGSLKAIPTGGIPYVSFITPGVLIQSATTVAIFYGLMIVWERESGILKRLISTPAPRYMIVVGRALAAGLRALIQSLVIFAIAAVAGVSFILNPLNFILALLIVLIFSAGFAAFSMSLASVFRSREKFVGIGQLIIFPLFFSSNALYPLSAMPMILQWVAKVNPMTYAIDALRGLLITGATSNLPIDLLAIAIFTLAMFALAANSFRRIVE